MPRVLVQAEGLQKSFGAKTLLDGATFQIETGERVALVGPNGHGKSTLLRMITGHERPDGGMLDVTAPSVSYFTQHPEVPAGATIRDLLSSGGSVPPELAAEMAELEARMADPALYESDEATAVVERYGEVQREIAQAKAATATDPADSPLFEALGWTEDDLPRKAAQLSGGERTRVFLVKVLSEADPEGLLILDEPTNHLDVETIEWLEDWLQAYKGAVLLVAHDRAFLDSVATRTLALERGNLESYPGNYSEYERLRDEDETRLAAQREREAKEMDRQKAVIEQFRHQKRFNGQMASRLNRLAKYRAAIDKTPDPLVEKVQFSLGFGEAQKSSNDVIRIRGLTKKYEDKVLFKDLTLDVNKGDRLGLAGANGAGKTTILRMLTGREKRDTGTIEISPGVKGAYYAQGNENLDVTRTLQEEVLSVRPGIEVEDVRALLGRFGFRNEGDLTRKVATLSGGERARLSLLKVIISPSNLLILDEPTNHLDIDSRAVLVRALNAYKGTLLVVSHDRWFMDSVVNKVAVLTRRNIKVYPGDFTNARLAAALEGADDTPLPYLVKKGFKDFETGTKYQAGSIVQITPAQIADKRLFKTALDLGWMVEAKQ
ncbi:MAG TPA: ABC-F family ATP-binding cassette domain-containing protein [Candidatus Thermoplasmatota archaeon]|nr:ABC-F family ATP-binding cassette domain-containing protein [Candidatus Thermoplasmatota archaeon]